MAKSNEYSGSVGQVIMGNATGPSLHVNMGKHDEETFITPLQRNRIAVKVKELIVATGRKQLDIYGDLLTEFGADNMDVFPRQKYKEACAYLDSLIERTKHIAVPSAKNCVSCKETQEVLHSVRLFNRVLLLITVVLSAGLVWSLFWKSSAAASPVTTSQRTCEHGKDRFTVGGLAENPDHTMVKCSINEGGVYWQPVESSTKKPARTPSPKKYTPQYDPD